MKCTPFPPLLYSIVKGEHKTFSHSDIINLQEGDWKKGGKLGHKIIISWLLTDRWIYRQNKWAFGCYTLLRQHSWWMYFCVDRKGWRKKGKETKLGTLRQSRWTTIHPFGKNWPGILPRAFSIPCVSRVCHPIRPYPAALPTQNSTHWLHRLSP